MFSTLDLDLRPGNGIGPFTLGSSLFAVLSLLRHAPHNHHFPQVELKYDPDTPSTSPILLLLRPHIDLLFSGINQRLHTICIRRLRDGTVPLVIKYKDAILSSVGDTASTGEVLRRVGVSRTFGPTYPTGDDLRYPGVWFSFEEDGPGIGPSAVAGRDSGKGKQPEDRLQEVRRVIVSQKTIDGKAQDALDEVVECPVMHGEIQRAIIKVRDGIRFHFYPSQTSKPLHIRLHETTAQDLMLDLGPPLRVHYKEDERMTIHSNERGEIHDSESDYFYNYFQHGLDFFISGRTHIIKKIIIHTNIPGSALFQQYKRCNWEIEGEPEDDEDEASDTPPRKRFYDRFETLSHFLSPRDPPPSMHLNRTDEEDGLQLPNPTSRLYGYDGIILEVLETSEVASVTLF